MTNSNVEIASTSITFTLFLACSVLSIFASLSIVTTYFDRETTVTSGFSHSGKSNQRYMPAFVLCAEIPYLNNTQNKILFTLEDFEENTIDPQLHFGNIMLFSKLDGNVSKQR